MKRPNWATITGTVMIVIGGCSVLNDVQSINFPASLKEKRTALQNEIQTSTASDSLASADADSMRLSHRSESKVSEKEIQFDLDKSVLDLPETSITWIVRFGYIGIFISMIYIMGGIFLLQPKNFSIKLSSAALILGIAFSAAKTMVLTSTGLSSGPIVLTMGATQLFSIIVDIILLSVIYSAEDKDAFT